MKWIETKKQLPKHENKVLVFLFNNRTKQEIIEVGYLCETEKKWFGFDDYPMEEDGFFVTHWMELPDKPKLEQCTISGVSNRFFLNKTILSDFALFAIIDNEQNKVVCHLVYDNGKQYCDEMANKMLAGLNGC